MTMQTLRLAVLCLGVVLASDARAADLPFDLGTFGEIPAWLIVKAPDTPMEKDPFEPMGGEARYAAMGDAKLFPGCGNPLEISGTNVGERVRIGDGVWEATRMAPSEMPGIFNEYAHLVVPEGYRYAYCRLDSPSDLKGGLLMGLNRNGGKCRLYLNGKELGTFDGGWGMETAREVPIELKKGANHLLARFNFGTTFACRLVGACAEPLHAVKVIVNAPNVAAVKAPAPAPVPEDQRFTNLVKQIPAPEPAAHPEFLGAKLARTMTLLESGKYTHRPVRIMFSGQSIEAGWTDLFIKNLRERYPDTKIVCENRAIGGWFVWRMQKLLKHDILRWQPDLVLFSAYQGTAEVWERFISELRSETTADIVIRTSHVGGWEKPGDPVENAETITLRRLAQKYDVEFVEVSREWHDYLKANQMPIKALLRDGFIHLNLKGDTLMALLYDRHFKYNAASREGWAERVRRFDVGRFIEDNQTDEIVLEGNGWKRQERFAKSNSPGDRLKLKFRGTRVDLVLPIGHGRATVLIDGKKPGEWNLFHGTRPQGKTMGDTDSKLKPNFPMTYHSGKKMQEETWVLALTAGNADADPKKANQRVKFKLAGSKTGYDGEGQSDRKFVSNSGRITMLPSDWTAEMTPPAAKESQPAMKTFENPVQYVWHILPDGVDTLPMGPGWVQATDHYCGQAYEYLTVADGLPCGVHELTLIPIADANPNNAFVISGVEVHCPPLARDASEQTRVP